MPACINYIIVYSSAKLHVGIIMSVHGKVYKIWNLGFSRQGRVQRAQNTDLRLTPNKVGMCNYIHAVHACNFLMIKSDT